MPIVALKCPKCNGDLKMDNEKKYGQCPFCGTQVIIEKSSSAKTKKTNVDKIDDWIEICDSHLSLNNLNFGKYPDKIIEADPSNPYGWFFSGLEAYYDFPIKENVAYLIKAMDMCPDRSIYERLIKSLPPSFENFYIEDRQDTGLITLESYCISKYGLSGKFTNNDPNLFLSRSYNMIRNSQFDSES